MVEAEQGMGGGHRACLLGSLGLGVFAEERRQHAVEREQAKERQLQLLDIQRIQQGDHQQGWSQDDVDADRRACSGRPRSEVRCRARPWLRSPGSIPAPRRNSDLRPVAGVRARRATLDGPHRRRPRRWNPETDRLETWPLEVSGPLAIRPDGSPWQLGPTYTEPDRPDRIPHDPRPNPALPAATARRGTSSDHPDSCRSRRGRLSPSGLDPRTQGLARGGDGS